MLLGRTSALTANRWDRARPENQRRRQVVQSSAFADLVLNWILLESPGIHVLAVISAQDRGLLESRSDPVLDSVRVLVLGLPQMLREIMRDILEQVAGVGPVVGLPHGCPRWPDELATAPDLMVVGADGDEDAGVMLQHCPAVCVLMVQFDGTSGLLYEMAPMRAGLHELSRSAVADVVRQTVSGVHLRRAGGAGR